MARPYRTLAGLLPGLAAVAVVFGTTALALTALAAAAGPADRFLIDGYVGRVAAFTILQAALSTAVSVLPGIAVARALARRPHFPGRTALLRLFGLPLVIPSIVAIFGIAATYGSSGLLAGLAGLAGQDGWSFPYGLRGILIAHAFFNLPLTVRLLLPALESIPGETWRLTAQLGMRSGSVFRRIEWPVLRQALPATAGLVFLLCFTSFAVVLVFGGGPRATTLEVAIYQALRLDFDLHQVVGLALLQVGICAALVLAGQRFALPAPVVRAEGRSFRRPDLHSRTGRAADAAWILAAGLFVGTPILAVAIRAAFGPVAGLLATPAFQAAVARTLAVGLGAGATALVLGWMILLLIRDLRWRLGRARLAELLESMTSLNLVVSPVVLGAGLFVLLFPFINAFESGLLLAAAINAIITLPYVIRTLAPALDRTAEHHDRACASLGIRGWNRFRIVEWPLVRRAAGRALALTTGLAMGDLAAIALFGSPSSTTLPLYLYRLMASYRMEEAAAAAGILTALCLGAFVLIERIVGGPDARA